VQNTPRPVNEQPSPAKVGQIFIVGNENTPAEKILGHIPLHPGQVLRYPLLQEAEKKLAELKLFVVDSQKGIRPTVTIIEDPLNPNAEYKDILVQVQEIQTDRSAASLKEAVEALRAELNQLEEQLPKITGREVQKSLNHRLLEIQEKLKSLRLTGSLVINERNFQLELQQINTIQAEVDLKIAEFYRQSGRPESARFYYELVCRRYPGTTFAVTAKQRMDDLKRPMKN
jgi:hypothetical protein